MILYYIAMTLATLFLIMCILSAIGEVRPPYKAASRNLFRGFLANARDCSPFVAAVLAVVCWFTAINGNENRAFFIIPSIIILCGIAIIEMPWLHGHSRSKKYKKLSPILPELPKTPVIQGVVGELSELNELPLTAVSDAEEVSENENTEDKK